MSAAEELGLRPLSVLSIKEWPEILRHPLVKTVSIGCIRYWDYDPNRDFKNGKTYAHAHNYDDSCHGSICFGSKSLITDIRCYHELAHLIAARQGHNLNWIRALFGLTNNPITKLRILKHLFAKISWYSADIVIENVLNRTFLMILGTLLLYSAPFYLYLLWIVFMLWFIFKGIKNGILLEFINDKYDTFWNNA